MISLSLSVGLAVSTVLDCIPVLGYVSSLLSNPLPRAYYINFSHPRDGSSCQIWALTEPIFCIPKVTCQAFLFSFLPSYLFIRASTNLFSLVHPKLFFCFSHIRTILSCCGQRSCQKCLSTTRKTLAYIEGEKSVSAEAKYMTRQ